jgi:hypothetical protein
MGPLAIKIMTHLNITEGTNVGQRSKRVLSEQEISSQFRHPQPFTASKE